MPVTKDDMKLGSGLVDDVDATIVGAFFGEPSKEYIEKADLTGAKIPTILYLNIEGEEVPDEMSTPAYSCGSNWEIAGDSASVTNIKKAEKHFWIGGSRAGALVTAMFSAVGKGDVDAGQEYFVKRGYLMTEAAFYTGLKFHWERTDLGTIRGSDVTKSVLLPVEFLGEVARKTTSTTGKVSPAEVDPRLVEKVINLASGKTERDLKQAVMKDAELKGNTVFMNQFFNKGLLAQLEAEQKLVKDPSGKYI